MSLNSLLTRLKSAFIYHFTETHQQRSEQQLECEKWLIPKLIPFSRYFLLPVAVLMQACIGSLYAWSGYNLPIEEKLYGNNNSIDRAIAVNVFYVAVGMFALSAAFFGSWIDRNGSLKGAMLGASFFYCGNLLTALGVYTRKMPIIFIGYGVFCGVGIGISYISTVSPLQKWFPDMRGLAGGMAVCGFGAGSVFSPFTQRALITSVGLELTFVILGSCYFFVMFICGLVLRMPPPDFHVKGVSIHTIKGAEQPRRRTQQEVEAELDANYTSHFLMTLIESLSSLEYWMIYFVFLGAEISGVLIISKVQSIVRNQLGRSAQEAVNINSILGGVNLLGRLSFAIVSDLIKNRRILYVFSLILQSFCVGFLPTALDAKNYAGVLVCTITIGFCYGGGYGVIAAFLADQFGSHNAGATNGIILTAWASAGIFGGIIFTSVYNAQKHIYPDDPFKWYDMNFRWILAPVLFSLILSLFIPCDLHLRKVPRVPGETFRFRLLNFPLVRFIGCQPHLVTAAEETHEWHAYLSTLHLMPNEVPLQEMEINHDYPEDRTNK